MSSQLALDGVGVVGLDVAEDVRVAAHQLVVDAGGDVGDREPPGLLGDRGVELDLVQHVAELLDQRLLGGRVVGVERLQRVDQLERLLDEVRHKRAWVCSRSHGHCSRSVRASWWKRTYPAPTGTPNAGTYTHVR